MEISLRLKPDENPKAMNEALKNLFYNVFYEMIDEESMKQFAYEACKKRYQMHKYHYYPTADKHTELISSITVSYWGDLDTDYTSVCVLIERILRPTRFVCAILMILYDRYEWFREKSSYVETLSTALNTMSSGGHLSYGDGAQEVIDIGTRVKPYDFAKKYPDISPLFTTYMSHLNYELFFPDRGEIF